MNVLSIGIGQSADDSGRLLAPNDGYFLESVDGGAEWSKRELTVEWPPDYQHKKVSLLRHDINERHMLTLEVE